MGGPDRTVVAGTGLENQGMKTQRYYSGNYEPSNPKKTGHGIVDGQKVRDAFCALAYLTSGSNFVGTYAGNNKTDQIKVSLAYYYTVYRHHT